MGPPSSAKSAPSSRKNPTPPLPTTATSPSKISASTLAAESSTAATTWIRTTTMTTTTVTTTRGWWATRLPVGARARVWRRRPGRRVETARRAAWPAGYRRPRHCWEACCPRPTPWTTRPTPPTSGANCAALSTCGGSLMTEVSHFRRFLSRSLWWLVCGFCCCCCCCCCCCF